MRSGVPQKDVWKIMNKINFALEGTGYQAYMYDNTDEDWLKVYIENEDPFIPRKGEKAKSRGKKRVNFPRLRRKSEKYLKKTGDFINADYTKDQNAGEMRRLSVLLRRMVFGAVHNKRQYRQFTG